MGMIKDLIIQAQNIKEPTKEETEEKRKKIFNENFTKKLETDTKRKLNFILKEIEDEKKED